MGRESIVGVQEECTEGSGRMEISRERRNRIVLHEMVCINIYN